MDPTGLNTTFLSTTPPCSKLTAGTPPKTWCFSFPRCFLLFPRDKKIFRFIPPDCGARSLARHSIEGKASIKWYTQVVSRVHSRGIQIPCFPSFFFFRGVSPPMISFFLQPSEVEDGEKPHVTHVDVLQSELRLFVIWCSSYSLLFLKGVSVAWPHVMFEGDPQTHVFSRKINNFYTPEI